MLGWIGCHRLAIRVYFIKRKIFLFIKMDWDKLSKKELRDFLDMYGISTKKLYKDEAQRLFTWLMTSPTGEAQATYPVLDLHIAAVQRSKIPPPNLTPEEINGLSLDSITHYATIFGIPPDPVRVRRILHFMRPHSSGKQLALDLTYNELSVLNRTSLRFSQLYQNSDFWRDKLLHDYGIDDPGNPELTYRDFCYRDTVNEIPRITPDGGATVIGDGISLTANLQQLKEFFAAYGDIADISSSCGFFLISYYHLKDANNLIAAFNSGQLQHYLFEDLKITGPYTKSGLPTLSSTKSPELHTPSPKSPTKSAELHDISPESEYSDYYYDDYESNYL